MNDIIEIEALSFEGLTQHQSLDAARAFEDELNALLRDQGLPPGMVAQDIERMDLSELRLVSQTPEVLGAELARAVYRRFG